MSKFIVYINIVIVVFPIFSSGIIWRIDIDDIDLALMSKIQNGKGVVVITLDEDIYRLRGILISNFFAADFFQHRQSILGIFLKLLFYFFLVPNKSVLLSGLKFLNNLEKLFF